MTWSDVRFFTYKLIGHRVVNYENSQRPNQTKFYWPLTKLFLGYKCVQANELEASPCQLGPSNPLLTLQLPPKLNLE